MSRDTEVGRTCLTLKPKLLAALWWFHSKFCIKVDLGDPHWALTVTSREHRDYTERPPLSMSL